MKTFKLTRKVQIILATLFVIVVGAIIVGTTSNNKASAATKPCGDSNCSGTMTCTNNGTGSHRWHCNVCSYIESGTCSGGSWTHKSGTTVHQKFCWACGYFYAQADCYDDDGDGVCDACGYDGLHTHSYTEKSYSQNDSTTHNVTLTCSCGATTSGGTEAHNFGTPTDNGDGKHSATCSDCGYTKTESHTSETVAGIEPTCTKAGKTDGTRCSKCKATITAQVTIPALGHSGATHANDGVCTVCGQQYETHEQSSTVKEYIKTETGHTPVYACTYSECASTYNGTAENHTGATHANGGVCTVCGQQYETHEKSSTIQEYIKTETGHTPVYACTQEGCIETYEGIVEEHTGATHENDGVCTVCGQQYETHEQSSTISSYTKTETTHTPVYACTQEGCAETYEGIEEEHTGATHANGGGCTVCGQQYETHEQSSTISGYTKTETGHTPVYACTQEGCTETYEGIEEEHTGATHANGGVCTVCGQQYETHEQSSTISGYIKTETTHTPIYACTHEGCTETYEGTEEAHNYVSGVCAVCGQEETHEEVPIEITSEKYEIDETYISEIQPGATVNDLKENLETNATEINIYDKNNEPISDTDKIGTGMKVELKKGDQTKTFTIVVKGDVDGDGTAAMLDISVINKYRLNKKTLDEAFLKAGDVTGDGKVDFYDILKINKFRLHKITEL